MISTHEPIIKMLETFQPEKDDKGSHRALDQSHDLFTIDQAGIVEIGQHSGGRNHHH